MLSDRWFTLYTVLPTQLTGEIPRRDFLNRFSKFRSGTSGHSQYRPFGRSLFVGSLEDLIILKVKGVYDYKNRTS
jgi:hypothetical protein